MRACLFAIVSLFFMRHLSATAPTASPTTAAPVPRRSDWATLARDMNDLGPDVQALSFASNAMISRQMQHQISTLRGQSRMIVGLFAAQALLLLSVAVTIVVRQRRQERRREPNRPARDRPRPRHPDGPSQSPCGLR